MFWSPKNGISSKYSFSSSPTFTCDPWSVYTGRPKSSSSSSSPARVSILIFDKKRFENYLLNYGIIKSKSSSHDKTVLQDAYEVLRSQVSNLSKLKHPNILSVIEPLEEHSKNFMFVTEYVTGSLESVFANGDEETNFFKGHVREDIVIQRGILEIVQALDFIHNRASFVHLDIQPRSVLINENSDWKVFGLGHLMKLPQGTNTADYFLPQYDPRVPSFMHLDLNYTAPEVVLDNSVSFKSDYFSLGLLIYMLYFGKSLFSAEGSSSQYKGEYAKFERRLATISWDQVFNKLPANLKPCIPKLMNRDIYSRYDNISEFLDSEFFQDPLIKTLNFLDDLPTKTHEERAVFLKGLDELLPRYPVSLQQRKFLTVLLRALEQECKDKTTQVQCISREVELIIKIGSTVSQLTFQERIFPELIEKTRFPIILRNATMALIENIPTLREKIKKDDFLELIAKPLLTFTLHDMEGDRAPVAQETLLARMNLIASLFDFVTMKNFLMPLISHLFTKTTSLMVKIACVSCFRELIESENIDSDMACGDILPLFKAMKTRDSRIMIESLKLYETIPKVVKNDIVLVEQLLPLIWNYSMASTLDRAQYIRYTTVINRISSDIQASHSKSLKLSHNGQGEADDTQKFDKLIQPSKVKREDPDSKAAKQIDTPAILPTRKPSAKKPSILAPRPKPNVKKTTPITRKIVTAPPEDTDLDNFDDFVSAASSPTPSAKPTPTGYGSTSRIPNQSTSSNLPPGFSISLQPSRKPAETTSRQASGPSDGPISLI